MLGGKLVRIASAFLIASAYVPATLAQDSDRAREENDIREAVFRHQFEHNASGQKQRAHSYCLTLGDKNADPSEQLMNRFVLHNPSVQRGSECHWTSGRVVDSDEKPALIFNIQRISWVSDSEVIVTGGYAEGNRSASSNTYTVKKIDGRWKVTSDRLDRIS